MKKGVLLIILLTVLLTSFISAQADIAYIVRKTNKADPVFLGVFDEMNLTIELIKIKDIKQTNFSNYKLIFIGDERLRKINYIPKNHSMVIANGYYLKKLGFLKRGKASKFASNSKLKVKKNNQIIQIYTKSSFKLGGVNLPYYYIRSKYRNSDYESIATTFTKRKSELGDVIAYLENPKKCFFGITKTKYWTSEARDLFKECVNFVLPEEPPEPAEVHDIKLIENYDGFNHTIRLRDPENNILENDTPQIQCNQKYDIQFKTKNIGNFTEDIQINLTISNSTDVIFSGIKTKTNLSISSETTTGNKNNFNMSFDAGNYIIEVKTSIIDFLDINPSDNFAEREIEVVCG